MAKELSWRVLVPVLIISFGGSFHYGYQTSVLNPSESTFNIFINHSYDTHYGTFLNDNSWVYLWPLINNIQSVGGLVGAFFIHFLLETLGRKRSFYITSIVFLISCLLQSISKSLNSWEILLAGRCLNGVGQGIQLGIQPVYFNEICPKSVRGLIGSMTGIVIEFAFLLASIVALPVILGHESRWPYLFAVEAAPCAVFLISLPFLAESPKYLASRGEFETAKNALLHFGRNEVETKNEIDEIRLELAKNQSEHQSMSFVELFSTSYIRKGVLLGLMTIFSAAFSGIIALSYFSTSILENGGLSSQVAAYATIGVTAPTALGALLGGLVIDRLGRRPILLIANTTMLSLNVIFIIFAYLTRVHLISWTAYANIVVSAMLTFTYGIGPAHVIWYLTAELVPQKARSKAHSLAMYAEWICIFVAGMIIYPLQNAIHEFSFVIHIIPLLISIIYFAFALPETKNRSTLEIMKQLGYKEDDIECSDNCNANVADNIANVHKCTCI